MFFIHFYLLKVFTFKISVSAQDPFKKMLMRIRGLDMDMWAGLFQVFCLNFTLQWSSTNITGGRGPAELVLGETREAEIANYIQELSFFYVKSALYIIEFWLILSSRLKTNPDINTYAFARLMLQLGQYFKVDRDAALKLTVLAQDLKLSRVDSWKVTVSAASVSCW